MLQPCKLPGHVNHPALPRAPAAAGEKKSAPRQKTKKQARAEHVPASTAPPLIDTKIRPGTTTACTTARATLVRMRVHDGCSNSQQGT